jgi:hypothetical protein
MTGRNMKARGIYTGDNQKRQTPMLSLLQYDSPSTCKRLNLVVAAATPTSLGAALLVRLLRIDRVLARLAAAT